MANSWEKLTKNQRDYPKPKFAWEAVLRLLKKQPQNPYLLAWKQDVALQLQHPAGSIVHDLKKACQQKPLTDTELLSYIYRIWVEASRRANLDQSGQNYVPYSIGKEGQEIWETAAKALKDRKAKLDLWSALFVCATREDCWEDARKAITEAIQAGAQHTKSIAFTLILARQLAAERSIRTEQPGKSADLHMNIAHRQLKQAYENSSGSQNSVMRVQNMDDLRFMAEIFGRQGRFQELFDLWDSPPSALQDFMAKHVADILLLKYKLLREGEQWQLLERHSLHHITMTIREVEKTGSSQIMQTLNSQTWRLWGDYLEAVRQQYPDEEARKRVHGIYNLFFDLVPLDTREAALTQLELCKFIKKPTLSLCKNFWTHYSHIPHCFKSLRHTVEELSPQEQCDFLEFINEQSESFKPSLENCSQEPGIKWFQLELNALKFTYLLTISLPVKPHMDALHAFIVTAIRLYKIGSRLGREGYEEIGCLVVMALTHLPVGFDPIRLQASMLVRHLTSSEMGKQNRTLLLLSTRLHLSLGLGTVAFHQYSQARIKEMLADTLSLTFLEGICRTHPLGAKGTSGFSTEAELDKVIGTIQRMEAKVDDVLFTDIQSFNYAQAIQLQGFKEKLRYSYTKYRCIAERNLISRLQGEQIERQSGLKTKDFLELSDNTDFDMFLEYECTDKMEGQELLLPARDKGCSFLDELQRVETIYKVLNGDMGLHQFHNAVKELESDIRPSRWSRGELYLKIETLLITLLYPHYAAAQGENFMSLVTFVNDFLQSTLKIAHQIAKGIEEWTTESQAVVRIFGGWAPNGQAHLVESLRLLWKLQLFIRDSTKKNPATKITVDVLAKNISACYDAIQESTRLCIARFKESGVQYVESNVRHGQIGDILRDILTDEDVRFYANEYVESAIKAQEGVQKIKLK